MAHSARYRYLSDLISYSHIRCTGARERVIWSGYINHHMDNMINQKLKYLVRNQVRYKQISGVKVSPIKQLKHECVKLINQHASFMYEAIKILVCENKIDTVEINKLKNRVITPGFKMISKMSLEPYQFRHEESINAYTHLNDDEIAKSINSLDLLEKTMTQLLSSCIMIYVYQDDRGQKYSLELVMPLMLTQSIGQVFGIDSSPNVKCYERTKLASVLSQHIMLQTPRYTLDHLTSIMNERALISKPDEVVMTVYRACDSGPMIEMLESWLARGVTVRIILEGRLVDMCDQDRVRGNKQFADKLSKKGAIVYNLTEGPVLHSKWLLVRCFQQPKYSYGVVSSGNFDDMSLCSFVDIMLLTTRKAIVRDLTCFYECLIKGVDFQPQYLMMPLFGLLNDFYCHLYKLRLKASRGAQVSIFIKLNRFDNDRLYYALDACAQAGANITVLVRSRAPSLWHKHIKAKRIMGDQYEHVRLIRTQVDGRTHWLNFGCSDLIDTATPRHEIMVPMTGLDHEDKINDMITDYERLIPTLKSLAVRRSEH